LSPNGAAKTKVGHSRVKLGTGYDPLHTIYPARKTGLFVAQRLEVRCAMLRWQPRISYDPPVVDVSVSVAGVNQNKTGFGDVTSRYWSCDALFAKVERHTWP
ncbi:MAG: hypothetical protein PHI11_15440, partial [Gallionella sp.]|nr:hypothetical protein [Gallionella sp.]